MCAVRVRGARREATGAHVDRAPWERGVDAVRVGCGAGREWFCRGKTMRFGRNDLATREICERAHWNGRPLALVIAHIGHIGIAILAYMASALNFLAHFV